MKIRYLERRGDIYEQCQAQVREATEALVNGEEITIIIIRQRPGFPGEVIVVIIKKDNEHFDTDWQGSDGSWFPARIRNAATVLRDEKLYGRFKISHCNGTVKIRKL